MMTLFKLSLTAGRFLLQADETKTIFSIDTQLPLGKNKRDK